MSPPGRSTSSHASSFQGPPCQGSPIPPTARVVPGLILDPLCLPEAPRVSTQTISSSLPVHTTPELPLQVRDILPRSKTQGKGSHVEELHALSCQVSPISQVQGATLREAELRLEFSSPWLQSRLSSGPPATCHWRAFKVWLAQSEVLSKCTIHMGFQRLGMKKR